MLAGEAGLSFHDDHEFGEVEYVPRPVTLHDRASILPAGSLAYLQPPERVLVREVFERHAALFSGEVGIAQVGEHKIKLVQGATPKRSRPYRMAVALKDEVSKHIVVPRRGGLVA